MQTRNGVIRMRTEASIDAMDIDALGIACGSCGTEIVLKVASADFSGSTCPNCDSEWNSVPEILSLLATALRKIAASNVSLRFRVTPP